MSLESRWKRIRGGGEGLKIKIKKTRELEPRPGVEPRGRGRCVEEKIQDTTCSEKRRGKVLSVCGGAGGGGNWVGTWSSSCIGKAIRCSTWGAGTATCRGQRIVQHVTARTARTTGGPLARWSPVARWRPEGGRDWLPGVFCPRSQRGW